MIGVCVTTLNEENSIWSLVRYFAAEPEKYRVFLVDDNSTDRTVSQAKSGGAHWIGVNHERIGIGPSLMRAWRVALVAGCDRVLQIDAGGSHNPVEASKLLAASDDYDLVLGSRFVPGAKYLNYGPKSRPWMSKLASLACNLAHGSSWKDWSSGYRVFSRPLLEHLLTKTYVAKMHGWQLEVLAHAGAQGFWINEVPITYITGRSSFSRKVAWEAFQSWSHIMNHVGWLNSKLDENE